MYRFLITAIVLVATGANAGAATPSAHWCRQGDPPLYSSAGTTCELAGNVITQYVDVCHQASHCQVRVDSATPRRPYVITCNRRGARYTGTVFCEGPPGTGIWTRFSDEI